MTTFFRRMYDRWMVVVRALAWINARIILTVVFYLILTPVGLVRRLMGYDPLNRRLDPNAATYHVPRERRPETHLEKQY
jgi:membrane protein required for beta-lactamase induction